MLNIIYNQTVENARARECAYLCYMKILVFINYNSYIENVKFFWEHTQKQI